MRRPKRLTRAEKQAAATIHCPIRGEKIDETLCGTTRFDLRLKRQCEKRKCGRLLGRVSNIDTENPQPPLTEDRLREERYQ